MTRQHFSVLIILISMYECTIIFYYILQEIGPLLKFNIGDDGVIRLATDTRYTLQFDINQLNVLVKEYQPNDPAQFTFNINFLFSNVDK